MWIDSNAYLGGAKAWKNEKKNLVCEDARVTARIEEKDGKAYLKTNLFDFIGGFACGIVDSDTLGNAFEPDQRFESPDGSAITFDKDYYGDKRGVCAVPGPFASRESLEKPLT